MAQPFTFPPPPPPPPRKEIPSTSSFGLPNYAPSYGSDNKSREYGNYRGRVRDNASRGRAFSSRGRGSRGTNGGYIGAEGFHHNSNSFGQDYSLPPGARQDGQHPRQSFASTYHDQKRPYSAAFSKAAASLPRPQAPPAIPSFGGDILPTTSPLSASPTSSKKKPRKQNQLGLTPMSEDHEFSSDEDEEVKLANSIALEPGLNASLLKFEYKGRTATLQTAADIAAWIAERKKNFPTAAKAEAAKREAEEKRTKWEESKKVRAEAQMVQRREGNTARQEELRKRALESVACKKARDEDDKRDLKRGNKAEDVVMKAALKTERLKQKLEKAQRDARRAEEALARIQHGNTTNKEDMPADAVLSDPRFNPPGASKLGVPASEAREHKLSPSNEIEKLKAELLKDEDDLSSDASSTSSEMSLSDPDDAGNDSDKDDATSSSGSSSGSEAEPDSDSAPEELTSKRTAPDHVPPPPRIDPTKQSRALNNDQPARTRSLCRNVLRTGSCRFGNRCRYTHNLGKDRRRAEGDAWDRKRNEQGQEKRTAKAGRKGLYHIMVEKELEEERRNVLRVIMEMGERGMLGEKDETAHE